MSSPPGGTNTAGAAESDSADGRLKICKNTIKTQINTNMEELKKADNKLAGNVAELKKEGLSIVEKLLKEHPELTDQDKFMEDFYKEFEGRLKQMAEVRKQLKNKGLPDLKATMGSIVHMSFYDQAVLPRLTKKDRPSSDTFLATFEKKFDNELDVLMKKKEFKMFKDAAVEVGGAAVNNLMGEVAEKDKELEQLRKQPKGSDKEKELQENVTRLQREVNRLTGLQKTEKEEHEGELATLQGRNTTLQKRVDSDSEFIISLEATRDELQTELRGETDKKNLLNKEKGSMQAKVKELETKMESQVTELETEKSQRVKAEEALQLVKSELDDAQQARTEANEAWNVAQIEILKLKADAAKNGSKAQDAETEETIKALRDQAEKDKNELSELKRVRDGELSKFADMLSKAQEEITAEKTRFKSLMVELENEQKATEEQRKEVSGLKEKHEQLETTHREVEKKNADLVQEKEELAKKHEDAVKAQETIEVSKTDDNKEVESLKARCDKLVDSEKSLSAIVKEQQERLKQFEAEKAAAGNAEDTSKLLEQLEGSISSENKLKDEIEKLKATMKDQTEKANMEKAKGGDAAKELVDLQVKHDKLVNDHVALREKKAQNLELQTALEDSKVKDEQMKELEKRNAELVEALRKVPAGKGTLDTVSEEDEDDKTPEQRIATYQQQWAAAKKDLDAMTNERNEANRELARVVSAYERMEKVADELKMESAIREEEHEAAAAASKKELEDALAGAAASQKKALAAAIAAVAAGGKAASAGEGSKAPSSSSSSGADAASIGTLGETTLAPRDPSRAPARAPTGRFEGLTDIFGRGGTGARAAATPPTANGAEAGGNPPGNPVGDKGSAEGYLSKALPIVAFILIVCALLTIGAEGHKASIWHAANDLTRAQYVNDWYYLTIPLPQWEYVSYLLKF